MQSSTSIILASIVVSLSLACSEEPGDPNRDARAGNSAAGSAGSPGAGGAGSSGTSGGGAGGSSAGTSGSAGASAGAGAGGLAGSGGASAGGAGVGGALSGAGGALAGAAGASAAGGAGSSGASAAGGAGSGGASGAGGAESGGASGAGGAGGASGAGGGGASGGSAGSAGAGAGGSGGTDYRPCPTNGDPCRILPFGDSITDGFNIPGGYRMKLFSLANADDHPITFVGGKQNGPNDVEGVPFPRNHEGHSGWKIAELLPRIPSPAFDTLPHIVLLMIGTNDCIQNDNLSQAPARLENLLGRIIDTAPDALVVVAQLTPLRQNDSRVTTYNAAIPGIVAELQAAGKHVMLVDQYTGFQDNQLADGVHPNQSGYDRMAGVWYEAIEALLP